IVGITDASTGAGGASGASGLGGSSNSNGSTGGTGVIVIGPSDASVSGDALVGTVGSGSLEDASCAAESHQGQQLPLDLYIMLDSSGSMLETLTPTTTTTKWDAVRSALGSFLNDPASAGLGVGIQYFPLVQPNVSEICDPTTQATDCGQFGPCDVLNACNNTTTVTGCNTVADCPVTNPRGQCLRLGLCRVSTGFACSFVQGRTTLCSGDPTDICLPIGGNCRLRDSCDATRYAMPAVDVAPLPGAAMGLINSLNAHMPTGLTPTSGALSGALSHARALATANPMHRVVVVLATDGLPTECTPADIPGIGALASAAAAATPSISTFVVGVFSPAEAIDAQPNLDALARAGNTGSAIVVNTGQDVTAAFLAALNAIRTTALACDYDIPQPEAGRLDYGKVNVQFTSGAGQKLTIGYVGAAANCGTNGAAGGWYYDVDPSTGTPTRIVVCDATCNGFKADPSGAVKILLGCTTQALIR
ncbi:MAG TPA: hypothetical protein VGL13_10340, partial [Polyangiaceae bacterium]